MCTDARDKSHGGLRCSYPRRWQQGAYKEVLVKLAVDAPPLNEVLYDLAKGSRLLTAKFNVLENALVAPPFMRHSPSKMLDSLELGQVTCFSGHRKAEAAESCRPTIRELF